MSIKSQQIAKETIINIKPIVIRKIFDSENGNFEDVEAQELEEFLDDDSDLFKSS